MAARDDVAAGISYDGSSENTKYKVKSFTYPSDLFDNKAKYNNNWVMININTLSQSKYLVEAESYDLIPSDRKTNDVTARDNSALGAGATLVGAGAIVAGITSLVNGGSAVSATTAAVKGGAAAAATAVPLALAGTASRTVKQLSAAIQLPMPNNMITPYTAGWGQDSTSKFDMMMRMPKIIGRALTNGDGTIAGNVSNLIKEGGGAADAAANLALSLPGTGGISAASGLAANPKNEMLFQGVDFRNFQLDYMFYPKNEAESLNVKRIIDMLKFHMFPEYKSNERFTFIYPSEFDITFYTAEHENPWVNKVATSVLTSMTVNYTPISQWAAHSDGSPVLISMSLQFKELSILTKENLLNPKADDTTASPNF